MAKHYQELRTLSYQDLDAYEREYRRRLADYSSLVTQLYPRLMKRGAFDTNRYPLFVSLLLEIQMLTQTITQQSQEIKELADQLPPIAHEQFYQEQLYQAIISTNEIEAIRTTRQELTEAEKLLKADPKTASRTKHLSTLRMYRKILEDDFLHIRTLEDIRTIYDQLTEGEIAPKDQLDGQLFRKGPVYITDDLGAKTSHVPPIKENQIQQMLLSWLDFINDRQVPFLIKAMVGHYFFENVHPFYDGNGRCGRYILTKYLSRRLDKFSGLILSQKINQHKTVYYKAFETTANSLNKADATFFVWEMLKLLAQGQEDIITTLTDKVHLLRDYLKRIKKDPSLTGAEVYVLSLLVQSKLFIDDPTEGIEDRAIVQLAKASPYSYSQNAIKQAIKMLEDKRRIGLISQKPLRHTLLDTI